MTIGEIAKKTDLSESTLRYYEKKGLLRVGRDHNGRRHYEESDIAWIKFIRRLKETGMLLKEIRRYAQLRYRGETTMPERSVRHSPTVCPLVAALIAERFSRTLTLASCSTVPSSSYLKSYTSAKSDG